MSQLDLPPEALTGRARELGFLQGFARETAVSGGALARYEFKVHAGGAESSRN